MTAAVTRVSPSRQREEDTCIVHTHKELGSMGETSVISSTCRRVLQVVDRSRDCDHQIHVLCVFYPTDRKTHAVAEKKGKKKEEKERQKETWKEHAVKELTLFPSSSSFSSSVFVDASPAATDARGRAVL